MIRIVSKREGFRRCGVPHSATPTEYPNDRFNEAELAVLEADPMLVVVRVPDAPDDPGKKSGVPHSATPSEYPNDRFSEAELAEMEADPMSAVVRVPDAPEIESKGKKKGGK